MPDITAEDRLAVLRFAERVHKKMTGGAAPASRALALASGVRPKMILLAKQLRALRYMNALALRLSRDTSRLPEVNVMQQLEQLNRLQETLNGNVQAAQSVLGQIAMARKSRGPSLKLIFDELCALWGEFPEVSITGCVVACNANRRPALTDVVATITATTPAITLESQNFGRFDLVLSCYRNGELHEKCVAREPNYAHNYDGLGGRDRVTHPHVKNERVCFGNMEGPAQTAIREGRLFDYCTIVHQVLQNYNPRNPFVKLEDWEGRRTRCRDCGERQTDTGQCPSCGEGVCPRCARQCSAADCSRATCRNCTRGCPRCDEDFCNAHQAGCRVCGNFTCADCMITCQSAGCDRRVCGTCASVCAVCDMNLCTTHRYSCATCGVGLCNTHKIRHSNGVVYCPDCYAVVPAVVPPVPVLVQPSPVLTAATSQSEASPAVGAVQPLTAEQPMREVLAREVRGLDWGESREDQFVDLNDSPRVSVVPPASPAVSERQAREEINESFVNLQLGASYQLPPAVAASLQAAGPEDLRNTQAVPRIQAVPRSPFSPRRTASQVPGEDQGLLPADIEEELIQQAILDAAEIARRGGSSVTP